MFPHHAIVALEIAHERAREAQETARLHRLLRDGPHPRREPVSRSRRIRRALAGPVVAVARAAGAFSTLAAGLGSRIEGRPA